MKIHKKIVSHYLSCTSPVDKEGYLLKKKTRNDTYQRRWLVLKANLLFYQERPADRHLLGVIVLEGCAVRRSDSDGRFAFCLLFQGAGLKSYSFSAGDEDTVESWVRALLSASHRYLSLILRDLHRQYEEAKHHQGSSESAASTLNQNPVQHWWPPATSGNEGRSSVFSTATKKSPKLWARRNAHITPLNWPAPQYGEWPLLGSGPPDDFSKLHDHYGQEVMKVREEWLKSRQAAPEESVEGDLIQLE
ncbi:sesquipedalian-1 [Dunckerocampus dactyliophorus]|uniref:sesquipedalian-1 n=1 Tax=Dunckerocampus dactyliophorus TaxID=161453 RepID=UPI0024052A2B|nr:sesquipedalian-1 [Dunckerocampus dactyliophorus]